MKTLLLSPLPPPAGGISTWTKLFLNSEQAQENEVDFVNLSVTNKRITNVYKKNLFDEIKRARKIERETHNNIKANKYEVVHINTSCSKFGMIRDYLCARNVNSKDTQLVIHCHCDTSDMVKGKLSEFIFKMLCQKADKIFCLNMNSYHHIERLTKKQSIIIPNFIEESVLSSYSRNIISDKIKNIIYVGHVVKSKGCDDIIEVAKRMPDINFVMIGNLSDEIRAISAPYNVKFLGEIPKDEVFEEMRRADLLLFPTHAEGFPNVVLEAMASGLPIVTTNAGAIPDMIEDKGGIIVQIGNVDEMVAAINSLDSKELREQMSLWNIDKVKRCYTVQTVIETIFDEYQH